MANQGQGELLPNHAGVHQGDHQQQQHHRLLDAARALGAAAAVTTSTASVCNPDAAQVFIARHRFPCRASRRLPPLLGAIGRRTSVPRS
ncbi:hypothetical protein SORBI_3010G225900 [Sorghum bicolor]|uniref:Uncharacterized protein n=1 Tax=Sorghum bicolor TaxID=4558 RepID=C5Z7S7_SORBI|nr:hypothetical protein SORBI_3010G225900 [Sorghum bicolor]